MEAPIRVLKDRVALQKIVVEEKTGFGLVLPAQNKDRDREVEVGVVVVKGPTTTDDLPLGARVFFRPQAAVRIRAGGEDYFIIEPAAIIAVYKVSYISKNLPEVK